MKNLNVIIDKKYKDNTFSLRFSTSTSKEKVTLRSVLSLMLTDRTVNYPTKRSLLKELDRINAVTLNSNTTGYGYMHVLHINLRVVNARFLKVSNLEDSCRLLKEVVYQPYFSQEAFDEACLILEDNIIRNNDNPSSYTIFESIKIAGDRYPLGILSLGDLDYLKTITLQMVIDEYQRMMREDNLEVLVLGDVDKEEIENLFVGFSKENNEIKSAYTLTSEKTKEITLNRDLEQTYLTVIYNTNTMVTDIDQYSLVVFNALFGQYPFSLLFQEIREKRSLSYSIRSLLITYDGVMLVNAGINQGSEDEVLRVINEQLELIKEGKITNDLVELAKKMLIDSYLSTVDSSISTINLAYRNKILNLNDTVKDYIKRIEDVTTKSIQEAANKLTVNTIVVLKKGDDNEKTL